MTLRGPVFLRLRISVRGGTSPPLLRRRTAARHAAGSAPRVDGGVIVGFSEVAVSLGAVATDEDVVSRHSRE